MDQLVGLERAGVRALLDRLVDGLVGLRDEGRFDEPNLDGSRGDYISFQSWEWPQGVGLYGLVRAWEDQGTDRYRTILEGWYRSRLAEPLPGINVNTTAPMLALSLLWARTRDEAWRPALDAWADRCLTELPRTEEMGFQHIVSDAVNEEELWVDTLVMVVLFLAAYGRASGRRDLVEEAERQVLVHMRHLVDRETGLWFHGWTFRGRSNFARARWSRGNAWALAAVLDYLDLSGAAGGMGAYLTECLRTHARALVALQTPGGGWRTLLDDPGSYLETSGTAGIAYGLLRGVRLGHLGPREREAGLRALDHVIGNIDADGVVRNVSYGTRMGRDLQFYRDVPIQPTAYGQAMALLLLTEALHHVD